MAIQSGHISEVRSALSVDSAWIDNIMAFRNASAKVKYEIGRYSHKRQYNKGEYLVRPGDKEAGIYCIEKGMVKVSKTGDTRKEFILWIAEPGDIVGLNAITDDEPFYFSAYALNDVTANFILASDLKRLLQKEPSLMISLMKNLCYDLYSMERRITSISRKKIRAQCAEMLITIAEKKDTAEKKNMHINYSISNLASLIGTTKNYLYKIISEFTHKEILSVRKRRLIINNLDALSLIAMEKD